MTAVILVEPEHPGNIGSVARVMANFGLTDLILINPQCDHRSQEARNLAVNAQDVLKNARVATWSVFDEFRVVVGTTGITGSEQNFLRTTLTPREAAQKIAGAKDVAIVFGRESNGMKNSELAKADMLVTIPTHKNYLSMNLSHSVAIMLYEISTVNPKKRFTSIPEIEQNILFGKIDQCVKLLSFKTEGQRNTQRKLWRNILGRSLLSRNEAMAAMGFFAATLRLGKHSPKDAKPQKSKRQKSRAAR